MSAPRLTAGHREFGFDLITAIAISAVCLVIFWSSLRLGALRFDVPMVYVGDALQYGYIIESADNPGGLGHIANTAAPFTTQNLDFPNGDSANILLARLLGENGAFGLRFNLFFLASIVLTALSGFAVARAIGLGRGLAAAVAIAFTLFPFHFGRLGHLFYTNYSAAAISLWLCVRILQPIWSAHRQSPWRRRGTLALIVLACVWCGSTGVYYAFFTCLALAVSGVISALDGKNWRAFTRAAILGGIIAAATAIQLVPTMLMQHQIGKNEEVAKRGFEQTEIFGLKITQLLMPIGNHRVEKLGQLRAMYDAQAPLVNENSTASIGVLGAIGLCLALALVLLPRLAIPLPPYTQLSSKLLLALLLFSTVGGFGVVFALGISPQLRALNRISPFVGYIALIVAAGVAQYLLSRFNKSIVAVVAFLAILLAYFDQAPYKNRRDWVPVYANNAAAFDSDRDFAQALAKRVPAGSKVLQLPFIEYPEAGASIGDYTQFRNNLHAPGLHWTHGAMKGRAESRWLQALSSSPPSEFIATLRAIGYSAIVVDKRGTTPLIEQQLAAAHDEVSPQLIQSKDGTQTAYVFNQASNATARAVGPDSGWYRMEGGEGGRYWLWAKGDALLRLSPALAPDRDCNLELALKTWAMRKVEAVADGKVLGSIDLKPDGENILRLKVPASSSQIYLRGGAAAKSPTADPRPVSFGLTINSAPLCR